MPKNMTLRMQLQRLKSSWLESSLDLLGLRKSERERARESNILRERESERDQESERSREREIKRTRDQENERSREHEIKGFGVDLNEICDPIID